MALALAFFFASHIIATCRNETTNEKSKRAALFNWIDAEEYDAEKKNKVTTKNEKQGDKQAGKGKTSRPRLEASTTAPTAQSHDKPLRVGSVAEPMCWPNLEALAEARLDDVGSSTHQLVPPSSDISTPSISSTSLSSSTTSNQSKLRVPTSPFTLICADKTLAPLIDWPESYWKAAANVNAYDKGMLRNVLEVLSKEGMPGKQFEEEVLTRAQMIDILKRATPGTHPMLQTRNGVKMHEKQITQTKMIKGS